MKDRFSDKPRVDMPNQQKANACPWCRQPMAVGAAVCLACGYNKKTGRSAGEIQVEEEPPPAPPRTWKQRWEQERLDSFWDYEIPLGLMIVSAVFITLAHLITGPWLQLPVVLFNATLKSVLHAAWMYAGMCMVELWTRQSYGPWQQAMLKTTAIASFWLMLEVAVIWRTASFMEMGEASMLLSAVAWPVIFFLLRWMFGMDSLWTMLTMLVIVATKYIASFLMPVG